MKFGLTNTAQSEGSILAHSMSLSLDKSDLQIRKVIKKGIVLDAEHIALLKAAGHETIMTARLEEGDVDENTTATKVAQCLLGAGMRMDQSFTGRVNIFATEYGLLDYSEEDLARLNAQDEEITVAMLPSFERVEPGKMIATVKVIPFAIAQHILDKGVNFAKQIAFCVVKPTRKKIDLIQTVSTQDSPKIIDKTSKILRRRLADFNCFLDHESLCKHGAQDLSGRLKESLKAGADMILVAGESAIVDRRDVVPAAIEGAGGKITHFGMPVDPGNLLLLGHVGAVPVIGIPGCARSPKLNGFDWVLGRLLCGLAVRSKDITRMGAGGLLKEIPNRPMSRNMRKPTDHSTPLKVACVVLADGPQIIEGGREQNDNNTIEWQRNFIRKVRLFEQTCGFDMECFVVVSGAEIDFRDYRSETDKASAAKYTSLQYEKTSAQDNSPLRYGISALPPWIDCVIMCERDIKDTSGAMANRLFDSFSHHQGLKNQAQGIFDATIKGKRTGLFLVGRAYLAELHELSDEYGVDYFLKNYDKSVYEISMDDTDGQSMPRPVEAIAGP